MERSHNLFGSIVILNTLALVLSGCAKSVPLDDSVKEVYSIVKLYDFQYYLSKDVVFTRVEVPKELDVKEGIGRQTVKQLMKEVRIKKNTPGKLLDITGDIALVSFDPEDNNGIPFRLRDVFIDPEGEVYETREEPKSLDIAKKAKESENNMDRFTKGDVEQARQEGKKETARLILKKIDTMFEGVVETKESTEKHDKNKTEEKTIKPIGKQPSETEENPGYEKTAVYVIYPDESQLLSYKGKVYKLTSDSINAYLLIEINPDEMKKKEVEVLPGREWNK